MVFGRRKSRDGTRVDPAATSDDGSAAESIVDIDSVGAGSVVAGIDGPFDVSHAPHDDIERIDLGALRIPALAGTELRLETDDSGAIVTAALVSADSALQLGAFAAPRNEGIWDEVRAELLDGIRADNGTVEEVDGPHGPELRAVINGPEGRQDLRFCGVDGPRWFLRAVFTGVAATDAGAAGVLADAFRAVIVKRGNDPMPVKDMIPMHLPKEITESHAAESRQAPAMPARGPEITETR
jgi:hypothetical protein